MNKTYYFDIGTAARIKKYAKKLKVSESKLVRHSVNRTTYADLHKELVEDLKHSKFILRNNLLK
jgi:hypothetical protein